MTSREYWEIRARQAQTDEYRYSEDAFLYIQAVMGQAKEKLWEKLLYYLSRIAKDTGLSYEEAIKKLTTGELDHYRMSLEEYLSLAKSGITKTEMTKLSMASNLYHMDSMKAMAEEINRYTHEAYHSYYRETKKLLEDSYTREMERLEMEAIDTEEIKPLLLEETERKEPVHPKPEKKAEIPKPEEEKKPRPEKKTEPDNLQEPKKEPAKTKAPKEPLRIDKRKVDKILKEPWGSDERTFSDRIWKDQKKLAEELKQELMQATVTGEKLDNVADRIAKRFDVHTKAARRLVHTENAYITSKARLERYKEDGVKEYQFIATLDLKTSKVCQNLDKKIFPVDVGKIGINVPPLHPHCRSTTVAWHGRESSERIARNPITGKSEYVDGSLDYKAWHDKHVKGNPEAEAREKMWQNRYQDDKQYQKYKAVLGKKAPKNLEEFQRLKYTDKEKYGLISLDFERRNKLLKNLSLKLPNADKATAADEKFTKYLFGGKHSNGLTKGQLITSKLGYDLSNYDEFRREILDCAKVNPATRKGAIYGKDGTYQGEKYEQKVVFYGKNGTPANAVIGWIENGTETKMTSVYIKEVRK